MRLLFHVVTGLILLSTAVAAQTDYTIGNQDVLTITVYDQAELSGKFTVDPDGTLTFPLLGRVKAGGLTLRGLEEDLKKRLADGYLRNPQVSVSMETYRSQRIFVMGEVRSPGAYQLTGDMSIIAAIAGAGSTTPHAADEVLIVRPKEGKANGPVMPTDSDSTVIRVNLREIQEGALSQNVHVARRRHAGRSEGALGLRLRAGQDAGRVPRRQGHDGAAGIVAGRRRHRPWLHRSDQDRPRHRRQEEGNQGQVDGYRRTWRHHHRRRALFLIRLPNE